MGLIISLTAWKQEGPLSVTESDHTRLPVSFVITAWLEPRQGEEPGEWRYYVRHVQSGQEGYFIRLEDLLAFLGKQTGVEPALSDRGNIPGKERSEL